MNKKETIFMRKILIRVLSMLGLLLVAGFLQAATNFQSVENKITKETSIQQLELRSDQGKVVLEGQAASLKDKMEAEKIAEDELNIDVANNIVLSDVRKTDEEIALDVIARIKAKSTRTYLFNTLSAESQTGRVILRGKVRDAYLSDIAEKAAMEVPGVQSVENRIEILPVSTGDDRLRLALYRRLNRDLSLGRYFLGAQPSINIIVEHGRVTLLGVVDTEVDRARARSLITGITGVLSVDNQLRVQ
jgi:osmotically-inducible protein OsmY